MDSKSLYATILKLLGKVCYYQIVVTPSKTGLHRDRSIHRLDHIACYVKQQRYVLQHTCPRSLTGDLLYRATKINIYNIRMSLVFNNLCSLNHRIYIPSIYLYAYRTLLITYCQLADSTLYGAYKSFRTNKLRIYHRGTITLAQHTETDVGNIFHRGKKERMV